MLMLLAAALPGVPLEAGAHAMRAEAGDSLGSRLHELVHGRHEQQESGAAATPGPESNRPERQMPVKPPTKSSWHDLVHGKHGQAPSPAANEATPGKQGRRQLSMDGMHELFHGLHGNQLRRKRNPLKQPARDRAQRRDAPLDRLSKDLEKSV